MLTRILVTGGTGLFGSNFINYISKYEPFGPATILNYTRQKNAKIDNCVNIELDINYSKRLKHSLETIQPHYVFHFAGNPDPKVGEEINHHFAENINTTNNILYGCSQLKYKPKVFYASSIVVYDSYTRDVKPASLYGVSKLTGEHLFHVYNLNFGLQGIIGRFGASLGNGLKRGLIFDIVRKLRSDSPTLNLIGNAPGPFKPYTLLDNMWPYICSDIQQPTEIQIRDYCNPNPISVEMVATICMLELNIFKDIVWSPKDRNWGDQDLLEAPLSVCAEKLNASESDIRSFIRLIKD